MKLHKWIIGSAIAGGVILSVSGIGAYQYVSKLNTQLDTTVLPHTTFEGVTLDGKSKKEVEQIIQQKIDEFNQKSLNYTFQNKTDTYTLKDLGVEYKEKDAVHEIFDEQNGSAIERYNMRRKAEKGELKREYVLKPKLNTITYDAFMKEKYNGNLVDPVNADLSISGTTVQISESKEGQKVDKDTLKTLTTKAISTKEQTVQVPIVAIKPERSTEDVQNMGITEVIAEYSTPMTGRNGNQAFNIQKSAEALNGAIIAPGETFSFNDRVGVTDAANGYKSAAVYVNGKVTQSAGGGVCQLSSTLYGSALRADLGIVARSNHSMPVHYLPLGQDAAVADYGPDLKFTNNTGKHIYLQAVAGTNSVTTRIFGTPTGKDVVVSSKVTNETENHIVAVTYQKVTQNGQVISNKQISTSKYKKNKQA